MKRILGTVLVFIVSIGNAQIINFPDSAFKAILLQADTTNNIAGGIKIDANSDGEITQAEALGVYSFSIQNQSNIVDITGIEYFTNVQSISMINTMVQTVDLTNLNNLEILGLGANQLTSINLNGLTNLWFINIGGNQLTTVDFSTLTGLKTLLVDQNNFTHLDLNNNPLFDRLKCSDNPFLNWINIRNNHPQIFTQTAFSNCWSNVPNLTTICVDDNEVVPAQNFITNCGITQPISIVTDCSLNMNEPQVSTLAITPNPTAGKVFFNNHKGLFTTVSVVNLLGQVVIKPFSCVQGDNNVDLGNLPNGVYLLVLEGIGGRKRAKVVKE